MACSVSISLRSWELWTFLSPMAAGTQAIQQGWRASYPTPGICNVIVSVLFMFLYEETKYS